MLQQIVNRQQRGAAVVSLDVAVVRCEGEMGEWEVAHLCDELFRLSARGCRKVVLDLTQVEHVDYRHLRPLAARSQLLRGAGGDLKLCGLSPYLAAILRAAGMEDEFELYRTRDDALLAFAGTAGLAVVR